MSHLRLMGVCEDSLFSQIPGRLREINSDSDITVSRLEGRLKDCSLNHPFCGSPPLNPVLSTCVIDVFASDSGVAVFETQGREEDTSHSVTAGARHRGRWQATKESTEDLKEGIAVPFLPKTFQDAISITRCLGIKYLWIDCLCIIRDDPYDWEREASATSQAYRNSYLTISAAASQDSYSEYFSKYDSDSYISPATISLGYTTPREATGPKSQSMRMEMGSFGKRFEPIAHEPLATRAWTFPERLLSPRITRYAHDQISSKCESCMNSEDEFTFGDIFFGMKRLLETQWIPQNQHGLSPSVGVSFIVGQDAKGMHAGTRWQGGWLSLTNNFTMRNLSGPVYEAKPHDPRIWDCYRILVEDEPDTSIGALHLDFPSKPIVYPCYALFLDPFRALILRNKEFEPKHIEDGTEDTETLASNPVLATCDVNRTVAQDPQMKDFTFKARRLEPWDDAKHGKLTSDKILHVSGDGSSGLITKDDPKV
ncbi:hypothetical protein F4818DRAFT_436516 [Hypoxylon cercidicola]|nr:hypothetical protein F4818DRAFT_436516 [Hypoxylon cercidicola]